MNYPLVSIITPCYNGERFVHRYFESILSQTYPNIELIFVNNGSTDKTDKIAISFRSKLEEKGVVFNYIYLKDNIYASGAISEGLKNFNGEYLTLPDSDDIIYSNNIEKKVDFLEAHKEFGIVICQCNVVNENDLTKSVGTLKRKKPFGEDKFFEDIVMQRNLFYTQCGYMYRASAFLDANPKRNIAISKYGPNFQLMLPVFYKYKCGYIDEVLADYLVRADSVSRTTTAVSFDTIYESENLLVTTLNSLSIPDKEYYIGLAKNNYIIKRFELACKNKDNRLIEKTYNEVKSNNLDNRRSKQLYFFSQHKILDIFKKFLMKSIISALKIVRRIKHESCNLSRRVRHKNKRRKSFNTKANDRNR